MPDCLRHADAGSEADRQSGVRMQKVFRYMSAVSALLSLVAACGSPQVTPPAHTASSAAGVRPPSGEWHSLASECPALPPQATQAFGLLPAGRLAFNTPVDDASSHEVKCGYSTGDESSLPTLWTDVKIVKDGTGGAAGERVEALLQQDRSAAQATAGSVVEDVPGVGDAAFVVLEPDVAPRMSMSARSANAGVKVLVFLGPGPSEPVNRITPLEAQIPTLAAVVNDLLTNLR
jgi:hypothetical protein